MSADWIDGFMEYTNDTTSPELYRKWGAIYTIAAALERKVWTSTMKSKTFPNLYIFLVGPPGVGKSEVTWRIHELLEGLEEHHVAPTSVTKASLIDTLSEATRRVISPEGDVYNFNSLQLCINELGVLIPAYDNEFMNTLTDLWDCKNYSEKRRTNKLEIDIPRTQLNLIGACTPSYLTGVLPEGAWDQGFLSRCMLIYSGEMQRKSLFSDEHGDESLKDDLKNSLARIGELYGAFKFSPASAKLIDAFWLNGGQPAPEHPKLLYYNSRRTRMLIKLCMIASASHSTDRTIHETDFQRALDWMLEAELYMPEIFKSMAAGGTGKIMEEVWYYIYQLYVKENTPVQKHRIIHFLQDKVPVHQISVTLDMMEQSKMIEKRLQPGGEAFIPKKHTTT